MADEIQPVVTEQPTEAKQKCMICNSLLAKTFFDLGDKRIYLCQNDANTMLRMACRLEPAAVQNTYKFVNEQIYGKEES